MNFSIEYLSFQRVKENKLIVLLSFDRKIEIGKIVAVFEIISFNKVIISQSLFNLQIVQRSASRLHLILG